MKKLLFSAIALVAFSSVSMGNTVDIEEIKTNDAKALQNGKVDCAFEKFKAYNIAKTIGVSTEAAIAYSYEIYFACMGATTLNPNQGINP